MAILQEVPPWWPPQLAGAACAEQRFVRTSRNAALVARRELARRWPDLMKSNGGGANAILAREPITEHRAWRMRLWPERRVAQLARLASGMCVVNYHGSAVPALAQEELLRLCRAALASSGDAPLVLGGDLNLRTPQVPSQLLHVAQRDVDHLFAHRCQPRCDARQLPRDIVLGGRGVELSDHPPLVVELQPGSSACHAG